MVTDEKREENTLDKLEKAVWTEEKRQDGFSGYKRLQLGYASQAGMEANQPAEFSVL